MINRFSSLRQRIDQTFLTDRLKGAKAYDRIAGYFSSSILEVAGEAIETMEGPVRLVCNSQLEMKDVETAKAAQMAIRQEWCVSEPEKYPEIAKGRFKRLFDFLRSGKMIVKVLPSEKFGLIHGKAGVITLDNGKKTAFLGSVNETYTAWKLNYEVLWEDDSDEAVKWVEEEFRTLWESHFAMPLSEFVMDDLDRLVRRTVISTVDDWRTEPNSASTVIESPIYRKEVGLAEHQKYFIKLSFDAHNKPHGARYILADGVGLGKTLQLAMAAQLMALKGDKPVLIIVPKTIIWQWQDEMRTLLDVPSAVWNGKQWVDENGLIYPSSGPEDIKKCPRRIGIVSQGLITIKSSVVEYLLNMRYECVIVDESHRARRKNLGPGRENEKPDANNLLNFLYDISPRTKSLLLATATPVQLYPVEAWDLLNAISIENESVLGNEFSNWRKTGEAISLVMGQKQMPDDDVEAWAWIRNPLPPAEEDRDFLLLRRSLKLADEVVVLPGGIWETLSGPDRNRIKRIADHFAQLHNPFIRHIVRRTREHLERTLDPETSEPFLKPIKVQLYGESEDEGIILPPYLKEAYSLAEEFCKLLSSRVKGGGFLKTLLLRRVGSSIVAGKLTAEKMLGTWEDISEFDEEEEDPQNYDQLRTLTPSEKDLLKKFIETLEANQDRDPKFANVMKYLLEKQWLNTGCIIFSQYYDSIIWLGEQISEELPDETIGIYAGGQKSGFIQNKKFMNAERDTLKHMVRKGEMRLLLGTDAASEGLNLQRLGTLINLDLPWNPTRLEQRKGRIQRIGQIRDVVEIYNMRYKDSVEDRVHQLLSGRLSNIYTLFGQIPDVLEDVWIDVALGDIEKAKQVINSVPKQHPFEMKYSKVEKVPWETCAKVLDSSNRKRFLSQGW
ncbi:MAG: phospholipase D-like domain-containing anti-phage protein [Thermodesulfovibrionales bacterium]